LVFAVPIERVLYGLAVSRRNARESSPVVKGLPESLIRVIEAVAEEIRRQFKVLIFHVIRSA